MKKLVNGVLSEMTAQEQALAKRISSVLWNEYMDLKRQLNETDYKAIKYAEGWLSETEYAVIREERQKARDRINEIEQENG